MSFTSYAFALFCIIVTTLYYTFFRKKQWQLLLIASMFFYACADVRYLLFIAITTVSSYAATMGISAIREKQRRWLAAHPDVSKNEKKQYKEKCKKKCGRLLLFVVLLNFGILFSFKYINFFIANINSVIGIFSDRFSFSSFNLILPLGISFYIFQTVGYVVDVFYGKYEAEKNLFRLALFVSFFPQLLQGPIGRYNLLAPTLFSNKEFKYEDLSFGTQRMLWGFFKKIVIADRLVAGVKTIVSSPNEYGGVMVAVGMLLYAAQLYCDFTGGIDITIGIAEVLGIKMSENFERPFFSKSVAEYWRRWHITLGTWFKDYTFYPLSTSKSMMKLTKLTKSKFGVAASKRIPVYLSTVILWFATGAWHGAKWNFIVWGLGNCAVILISQELIPLYRAFEHKFPKLRHSRFWDAVQIIRTNGIMCFLRTLDCYSTVGVTFGAVASIFVAPDFSRLFDGTLLKLGLTPYDYAVSAIGIVIVFSVSMIGRYGSVREKISKLPNAVSGSIYLALFFAIIVFGAYGVGYDAGQFIYTQF